MVCVDASTRFRRDNDIPTELVLAVSLSFSTGSPRLRKDWLWSDTKVRVPSRALIFKLLLPPSEGKVFFASVPIGNVITVTTA